jgi:hypothetical protein
MSRDVLCQGLVPCQVRLDIASGPCGQPGPPLKEPPSKLQDRSWPRVRDLAVDTRRKQRLPENHPRVKPTLAPIGGGRP